ncbi:MAG: hypothetical protein V5A59_11510 [Bacteroidales bacterium]|nr:hypothetical protein [Bacteroidales bacterium]
MSRTHATKILMVLVIFLSQPAVWAQESAGENTEDASWAVSAEWWNYHSFSQQKPATPIKAGYPVIESQSFALGISHRINRPKALHNVKMTVSLPSSLDSDNGKDRNHLLQRKSQTYFRSGLDYHLIFPFFQWKGLSANHGLTSGLLYENRELHYLSGRMERTEDINLYIGPALQLNYDLLPNWIIEGSFDARFYLPYSNYGKLQTYDVNGESVLSSGYSGFYYQTLFKLGVSWQLPEKGTLRLGAVKNDLIGFASPKPAFYANRVMHFKLDRLFHYYIMYRF